MLRCIHSSIAQKSVTSLVTHTYCVHRVQRTSYIVSLDFNTFSFLLRRILSLHAHIESYKNTKN